MMTRKIDKTREHRIEMEIIVDAYGSEERAMGWYYYLEDKLGFPFKAKCIQERSISPLRKGETVDVMAMAPEEECQHDMFVQIRWEGRKLAVPLAQLKGVSIREDTKEAVEDWHYWVVTGRQF
jgi:hypothetical protein